MKAADRLWRRIIKTEFCWIWTGSKVRGYGNIMFGGRVQRVHRVVYELLRGTIGQGLELDHLCRQHSCVNPEHLEPVTHRENVLRGNSPAAIHARQTHCDHGHRLSESNTYRYDGGRRRCRTCTLSRNKKSRDRINASGDN